jgi:hypothetical protein
METHLLPCLDLRLVKTVHLEGRYSVININARYFTTEKKNSTGLEDVTNFWDYRFLSQILFAHIFNNK